MDSVEVNGYQIPEKVRRGYVTRVITALTGLLLIFFITISQMSAWERVHNVRNDLNEIQEAFFIRNSKNDCLALYRNDVQVALGVALAANNELFIAVTTRTPAGESPEEQAAEVEFLFQLGEDLKEANAPLIEASAALERYDLIDPPPSRCPHPNAQNFTFDDSE